MLPSEGSECSTSHSTVAIETVPTFPNVRFRIRVGVRVLGLGLGLGLVRARARVRTRSQGKGWYLCKHFWHRTVLPTFTLGLGSGLWLEIE